MVEITDELKYNFLVYAAEVNSNRAFPNVIDGLKPSQRAVLWEMYAKGYSSDKPHVKCAKVAGGVIANLWPHGDASSYEALVRMSQPWVNNVPEIDFHGANGSLQGGPEAASSRYTECRLSKASEDGFFRNIKKDVVDFIDNFSEDEKWPSVFPAVFPRLFVNGSQGIGYTIAQEWEPGNLSEFFLKVKEYIKAGKVSYEGIYPDYPTGGIIINKSAVKSIYETGKGTVMLRGKASVSGDSILITELPYQVYAEPFIQKIKDAVNAGSLSGIEDICNKSGDSGLLIEIECSAGQAESVLAKLYKTTDLQTTFSANQMALVDGVPQMLNLDGYLKVYVEHNVSCLVREYSYDLSKAKSRLEIVDGLTKALSIIDDVIKTIKASRSSEAAKQELSSKFGLTDSQAKAIVDMRLGKLANMETDELMAEKAQLEATIKTCEEFLQDPIMQKKEFIKRLSEFVKTYGYERRTEVIDLDIGAEKKALKESKPEMAFDIVFDKSRELKRMFAGKAKDAEDIESIIRIGERERFVLISASGKMYKLNAKDVPLVMNQGSKGKEAKSFFDDDIVSVYSGKEADPYLFMITEKGLVKKIKAETVFGLSKLAGAPIMNVKEGDRIIDCRLVDDLSSIEYQVKNKKKLLYVCDFLDKGRSAGGTMAISKPFTLVG